MPVLPDLDQDRPERALRDDPVLLDSVLLDRLAPLFADAGSTAAAIPQMSQ